MKPSRTNLKMSPQEKKLAWRALTLLGSFTLVLSLAGLASLTFMRRHQPMIVPRVIGLEQHQALGALSSKGLHLVINYSQYDERMPAGLILLQKPPANEYLKRGQAVTVVLSKGSPQVKVPNVVGLSFPEAQITLAGAKLRAGRESLISTPFFPKDTVIAQVPTAGDPADSLTTVALLVSSGAPAPAFVMPNLRNQPLEAAFKTLRPTGVTIEKIKSEVHDDLASETVLSQTPPAGSKVQKNDDVSFVISMKSSDAKMTSRYVKVEYDMPEGNSRRLQIDVFDGSGTRTIYNRMGSPKDHVEVGVSVSGKATAQVYLNQEFVKEIPLP